MSMLRNLHYQRRKPNERYLKTFSKLQASETGGLKEIVEDRKPEVMDQLLHRTSRDRALSRKALKLKYTSLIARSQEFDFHLPPELTTSKADELTAQAAVDQGVVKASPLPRLKSRALAKLKAGEENSPVQRSTPQNHNKQVVSGRRLLFQPSPAITAHKLDPEDIEILQVSNPSILNPNLHFESICLPLIDGGTDTALRYAELQQDDVKFENICLQDCAKDTSSSGVASPLLSSARLTAEQPTVDGCTSGHDNTCFVPVACRIKRSWIPSSQPISYHIQTVTAGG
ncbi:hypothetical protein CEUSTIGMA_g10189.t1 [Chlamydomonas eustigma]|uniref:Uncharacterized protein n=1 Tax=Chlamydomonas eustigma TaxID=1157962 RepID=A0A250XI94_9CHLO|nr:hypothetical protein CEUSTIGMA_g10189.t1 [Chlamydomonas eustigma]|eukprot:GAX82763.1 hypothetical protein CEUSTIGMA_g10189.t1 [Chlamydomonas eustigma]